MPSSTSYLRDDHDVSALKYFSALCMTIVATLEDVAAYFVRDRRDDGIELATIIEPEDFQRAPSRAMVKKAVARLEVPFWRRPPMLSRSSIEEERKWMERRGGTEWEPPPAPKQSKKKSMKKKRNADLRTSSREEAVQQQQRQLENQKQQQQLKEKQPDKGQRRDSTDGAAGEGKETSSSNQPRRMTAETCTPSTTSLGASCSFFGSGYSTIAKKANQNETPAIAGDSPASSKKSSKWSTLRAKVKAFQRSGVLKKRTASGRLLGMGTGPGESTKAREGRKVFPEGLALIHRRAIEIETVRKFDRVDTTANSGDFWFMVDAVWMKAWVDFVMEKRGPPGPISNYNLYLEVSELSLKRQQSGMKGKAGMNSGREDAPASSLDLKIRPGMETGRDYRALHPLVWFVYREIYSTDGAPEVCRWEPNIYSAEVEASSKLHVSRSCQTEVLSVLLRSVSGIQQQKMSPLPPMKNSATAPGVMVKVAKENSERFGAAGGAVGRVLGRLTHSTQKNISKKIRRKRKKVLPRQESKRNNSLAATTTTTVPEKAPQS